MQAEAGRYWSRINQLYCGEKSVPHDREFLSTSYYIEEYSPPSKKVRFVSVNDHFDIIDGINNQVNETSSQIRTPITNAFNEQISLDIRKKTQSILGMKVTRGISIGPWAPFVYRKTENDHLKLGS